MNKYFWIFLLGVIASPTKCFSMGELSPIIRLRIVDSNSRAPIPNTVLSIFWVKNKPFSPETSSTFYRKDLLVTDSKGECIIPAVKFRFLLAHFQGANIVLLNPFYAAMDLSISEPAGSVKNDSVGCSSGFGFSACTSSNAGEFAVQLAIRRLDDKYKDLKPRILESTLTIDSGWTISAKEAADELGKEISVIQGLNLHYADYVSLMDRQHKSVDRTHINHFWQSLPLSGKLEKTN